MSQMLAWSMLACSEARVMPPPRSPWPPIWTAEGARRPRLEPPRRKPFLGTRGESYCSACYL